MIGRKLADSQAFPSCVSLSRVTVPTLNTMLTITTSPAHQIVKATTGGLLAGLCFARILFAGVLAPPSGGGPAACQEGGRGVPKAPPPTSPTPPTRLRDLSRCPRCSFSAAPLSYGVRDQAIRPLHVLLLFLCVGGRQEDPDQACDGHRRRTDGRRHRAGERASRPRVWWK